MHSEKMPGEIEYRLATLEDAPRMVAFHNSYYGVSRTLKHWIWQYDTYDSNKAVFAFAEYRGGVIATQGISPIEIEIGGKPVLSGKCESTLCLPAHRGTGVMEGLFEYTVENCVARGMRCIWAFTDAVKAYRKFGFAWYPDIEILIRPGNVWIGIALRMRGKPLLRGIASAIKYVLRFICQRRGRVAFKTERLETYQVKRNRTPDKDLRELCERLDSKCGNVIRLKYDETYLSWRVREHPLLEYQEYQVYQGDNLLSCAFIVLTRGVLYISDILSRDTHGTRILIHAILNDYRTRAGEFRCLVNTKDPLAQDAIAQLRQCGFSSDKKTSKTWNFMVRDLKGDEDDKMLDISNWHLTDLWTEGFEH
jgi:GNAT superfamily N-acetyltransferase